MHDEPESSTKMQNVQVVNGVDYNSRRGPISLRTNRTERKLSSLIVGQRANKVRQKISYPACISPRNSRVKLEQVNTGKYGADFEILTLAGDSDLSRFSHRSESTAIKVSCSMSNDLSPERRTQVALPQQVPLLSVPLDLMATDEHASKRRLGGVYLSFLFIYI